MIALDLTPTEESRISVLARQIGLAPSEYVKKLVTEHLPPVENITPVIDAEKAAAIALLESWIASAPTNPEEIRQAEADLDEFMQNLNQNRIEIWNNIQL